MFAVGMVLLAVSALLAPWLQDLANYPVETAGLVMAPRGFGTMAAMMIAGRLTNKVDARLLMGLGIVILCLEPVPHDRLDPGGVRHDGGHQHRICKAPVLDSYSFRCRSSPSRHWSRHCVPRERRC